METFRAVRIFRNGNNQAVRIPREFELPGKDALMTKEGDTLVIRPSRPRGLIDLLKSLKPLREDFPAIKDRAPEPLDL